MDLDIRPVAISNLKINITYFNINFRNRISSPGANVFTMFSDSKFAPFADFSGPDADFFTRIENFTHQNFTFIPFFGPSADFSEADAVFNNLVTNLSQSKTTGLDFSISYGFDSDKSGNWNFTINGTYLFDFKEQFIKGDPTFDLVGTISNPVKLRMNSSVSWGYEGFTTNLTVNYVDSYVDNRTTTDVPVDS